MTDLTDARKAATTPEHAAAIAAAQDRITELEAALHVNGEDLMELSGVWKWDGDLMTCRDCRRSLIASRNGEAMHHRAGCTHSDRQHPWQELRAALQQGER